MVSQKTKIAPVGIIGGGMSGILTARLLQDANIPYVVFEKSSFFQGGQPALCEDTHTMNLPWYKHWGEIIEPMAEAFLRKKYPERFAGDKPHFFPSRLDIFRDFIPTLFPENGNIAFDTDIVDAEQTSDGYKLTSTDGRVFTVSKLAVTTGRIPNPQIKDFDRQIGSHYVSTLYYDEFKQKVPLSAQSTLLIIGAGNSSLDMIMTALKSGFKGKFILTNPDGRTVKEYKPGSFKIDEDKIIEQVREASGNLHSLAQIFADAVSDQAKGPGYIGSFDLYRILKDELQNQTPGTDAYNNILCMSRRFGSMATSLISRDQAALLEELVKEGRLFQLRGVINPKDTEVIDGQVHIKLQKSETAPALDYLPDSMSNPRAFDVPFYSEGSKIIVDAVANASPYQDNMSRIAKEDMPLLTQHLLERGMISISPLGTFVSNDPHIDIIGPLDHRYAFGSISFSREGAERFVTTISPPAVT